MNYKLNVFKKQPWCRLLLTSVNQESPGIDFRNRRPLRWKPRKQPQRSKAQYSHASAFNGQLDFKFNSLTINVYPDLGQNASSQMKQPTFAYLLKGRWFSPACTCSRNVILFKNEAVRMKALLTNIELDIRYSSVLSHMLFLISAWRNTCRTSASL